MAYSADLNCYFGALSKKCLADDLCEMSNLIFL